MLGITQPAVSRMVKRLETELGVPLLLRAGRCVALTEAGQLLVARAADLDRQARQVWEEVRAGSGTPRGRLAFGAANIVSQWLMLGVLPKYHQRFPRSICTCSKAIRPISRSGSRSGASMPGCCGALALG